MSTLIPAKDSVSIFKLAARLAEKGEETAFLHIQEACKATTSAEYYDKLQGAGIKVYALKADVEAGTLTEKMHPGVELIDYTQWVSLLMGKHDRIVSWTG